MATINIVGAGVAGLATAAFLSHATDQDGVHKHSVEITDRRDLDTSPPRVPGTAFGLWPGPMAALDRLGIGDRLRADGVHVSTGTIRTHRGRVLTRLRGQDCWLVPRDRLTAALIDTLSPQVQITHGDVVDPPTPRAGEVLVGADGVHSRIRRAWWPGTEAASHGVSVLRGTIAGQLPQDSLTETWGPGWLVGFTPNAGPSINWFAVVPEHRGTTAECLANLRALVGGHLPDIDRILAAAEPERTLVHGINTAPPMRSMVSGRVVLVGDAAHAMTPNTGRGACSALLDGAALADELARVPAADTTELEAPTTPLEASTTDLEVATTELQAALVRFQRRRLLRTQATRAAAAAVMRVALSSRRSFRPRRPRPRPGGPRR